MYNLTKKYSKTIIFKKISYQIIEDMKYYKSEYFDDFLEKNQCKGVLTSENIDKFIIAEDKDELEKLYKENGITINDEWDAYDALENFLKENIIDENTIFEYLWIKVNCKLILENVFKKIKNDDISKNEVLYTLQEYIKEEFEEYSYLSKRVLSWIIKSKLYLLEKINSIFSLNYLINYENKKQLEIFDNTIDNIYSLIENNVDNNINLIHIKELEVIFSVNNLATRISNKAKYLLDENSNYYNQISELKNFINIFHYDVVIDNKYLEVLSNFYYKFINLTATVIILKELKADKKDRVIKLIDIYLSKKESKYKDYFIDLKKRLNFYDKNITLSIIELFYKELMDEQLEIEKIINKIHRELNVNKKTLLNSKHEISNKMVFQEKVASLQKILIKK